MTDSRTWLGDTCVEIDDTHFTKPEAPKVQEEEEEIEPEFIESVHELPPIPPFSLEVPSKMIETSEEQYIKGNKLLERNSNRLFQTPKSAHVIKPVVPKL